MGYMRHHAIVVSGSYMDFIDRAHAEAARLEMRPTGIVESHINGVRSFMVPPDGSKEGWEESNDGDLRRDFFVRFLESLRYEDGSSPLDWAVVQYGDDEGVTCIVSHSDAAASGSADGAGSGRVES